MSNKILDTHDFSSTTSSGYSTDKEGNKKWHFNEYQFILQHKVDYTKMVAGFIDITDESIGIEIYDNEVKSDLLDCIEFSESFSEKYRCRFLKRGAIVAKAIMIADNEKTTIFQTYPQLNKN